MRSGEPADDTAARSNLALRIAHAYDIDATCVRQALAETPDIPRDVSAMAMERHGDEILLIDAGETIATLDLGDILPGIASGCSTLDPYGDPS